MALQLLDGESRFDVRDTELANVIEPDPDVLYAVRQILPATHRQIQQRCLKPNPQTHRMEPDEEATIDALVDYAVVDWTGWLLRGEPAPCTKEHKTLLDRGRKLALIAKACSNRQTTQQREDSFRQPAGVV